MSRVSIIVPVFNRERTLRRALNSILNQTYKEYEVLICDDGSYDRTKEIAREFVKMDSRFKLLELKENKGAGAARNLGMKNSTGDFIAFLDSDDEWLPDKLEKQVQRMDNEPKCVGVCLTGSLIIKNDKKRVKYIPKKEWEHDTFKKFVLGKISFITSTILFRKECLFRAGYMNEKMKRNQDIEFLLRIFYEFKLAVTEEMLAVCYIDTKNTTNYYEKVKEALPCHLSNLHIIKEKLGNKIAMRFLCSRYSYLISAAIRERKWKNVKSDLMNRIKITAIFWPEEIWIIIKAFLKRIYLDFYYLFKTI